MRKILTMSAVLVLAVSCLRNSGFNTSYSPIATFEYGESAFNSDSLYFDTENKIGFMWDCLAFYHKVEEEQFKGGFMVSRLSVPESGDTESLANNEYRVNSKTTGGFANKFAVFCESEDMPRSHLNFVYSTSGGIKGTCTMRSMYVNNTVALARAVQQEFVDGDVLFLKVTGYLKGNKTDEAEIKLAEFTPAKDSVLSRWTALDLSKLGSVDSVRFSFVAPEGKDIPRTVCIDDMIATINLFTE